MAHLQIFGCEVWITVADPKIKSMEPHRIKGIYLGFDSPVIIRYKLYDRDDVYKARFQNCKFIETCFPGSRHSNHIELSFRAQETLTLNPDPQTALTDAEV